MYDVIIVGGGPSGASAGRRAGKLGLNTLLLEKEELPQVQNPVEEDSRNMRFLTLISSSLRMLLSGKLQGQGSFTKTS